MRQGWRRALWSVAALEAALALGMAFEVGVVVEVWPFGGGQLTHLFVGSIFAAAAASKAWCLLRREPRGFVGIALDALVILAPLAVYSFIHALDGADDAGRAAAFGAFCVAGAVAGAVLLREALRHEWRDPRPSPPLVRWSFGVFVVLLLLVSASLLARRSVLPWPVTDAQSTAIGLMFLGAAAYFVYGLVQPRSANAGGQLAGFLAYDLVLIGPFLDRLPGVAPEFRTELIVYTAVVVYSACLAVWYLLAARERPAAEVAPLPAD